MNLPYSNILDTSILSAVFNNTSATYKYYWLLALLESVEEGKSEIRKRELFARMLANSWYTVNYFHVSFGSQDLIQQAINAITKIEAIPVTIRKENLITILVNSQNKETAKLLHHFDKNVPHWFLTPWIRRNRGENDTQYRNRIYSDSQRFSTQSLYALFPDRIQVNHLWIEYLRQNAKILKDYCYWNLSNFLQVRNPSVPDIPGKLIKPPLRGTLSNQRKNYWDIVFRELGTIDCLYTDTPLHIEKYALDHFVPHAFVSHDLIWNLAPIDVTFNSIKSDKLPSLEIHFDKFFEIQMTAFQIISYSKPKTKLLDDYIYLFNFNHEEIRFDYNKFRDTIASLVTIASNNGFQKIDKQPK